MKPSALQKIKSILKQKHLSTAYRYKLVLMAVEICRSLRSEEYYTFLKLANNLKRYSLASSNVVLDCKLIKLPVEIIALICCKLDVSSIASLQQSCKDMLFKILASGIWAKVSIARLSNRMTNASFESYCRNCDGKMKIVQLINAKNMSNLAVSKLPERLEVFLMTNNTKVPGKSIIKFLSKSSIKYTLNNINFSGCIKLDDKTLNTILSYFPALKSVDVSGCDRLTDAAFAVNEKSRSHLDSIKNISLKNCLVTNQTIRRFRFLQSLNVNGCKHVTKEVLLGFKQECSLEAIDITDINLGSGNITLPASIAIFAVSCSQLRSFKLVNCPYTNDDLIISLFGNCSNLDSICLNGSANITDLSLSAMLSNRMRIVSLANCPRLSQLALQRFVKTCCEALELLNISYNENVCDDLLLLLAKLPKLTTLAIAGCKRISGFGLLKMTRDKIGCNFKSLNADDNFQVSVNCINELRKIVDAGGFSSILRENV